MEIWLTKGNTEISEGAAGEGDINGELSVAKGGEESAEAGNGVGKDNGRACVRVRGFSGGDKNSSAHHSADAESNEVVPTEGSSHVGSGTVSDLTELLKRGRDGDGPESEAFWGLTKGVHVGWDR